MFDSPPKSSNYVFRINAFHISPDAWHHQHRPDRFVVVVNNNCANNIRNVFQLVYDHRESELLMMVVFGKGNICKRVGSTGL